jgi:hypothetical protein
VRLNRTGYLFVTQPPKLVLSLPKEPDSLVSLEVKPLLLALPAHLPAPVGDAGTGGFGGGQTAKGSKKAFTFFL